MKPDSEKRRAVVIGSGVGGAGISALLQRAGFDVLLLERNAYPGGKASTFEQDGFFYDTGVHYNAQGPNGPLALLNQRVQGDLQWRVKDPYARLVYGDKAIDLPQGMRSLKFRYEFATKILKVRPRNALGIFRAYRKIVGTKTEKDAAPYDNIPLKDFCDQYTDDKLFHGYISWFCMLGLCIPYTEASAGEFMLAMSNYVEKASVCYPKGGFKAIPEAYIKALERDGGKVIYENPVKRIVVKDGKAVGVEADRFYEADVVVSNAGIQKTLSLVGEENLPQEYVKRMKGLKYSYSAVTIKYLLDKPVFSKPSIVHYDPDTDLVAAYRDIEAGKVPEDKDLTIWLAIPSNSDPYLVPPGKQLTLAFTMGGPPELENAPLWDKILDRLDKKILCLHPEMEKHIIRRIKTTPKTSAEIAGRETGDIIGLAQRYDQVGRNKPSPATPVKNLYLVGCSAGGRGIGTEQAGDSALKVSEKILKDLATQGSTSWVESPIAAPRST
ncbi:MAG: NAD(P)/FAD-dependent oxidoreductase [Bacteroidetes bacterium]|nr:MAG: NAD(P)/FAD-dependent oxidoreductase [Bacteroidota bacterium]